MVCNGGGGGGGILVRAQIMHIDIANANLSQQQHRKFYSPYLYILHIEFNRPVSSVG